MTSTTTIYYSFCRRVQRSGLQVVALQHHDVTYRLLVGVARGVAVEYLLCQVGDKTALESYLYHNFFQLLKQPQTR